jgi:broad specificity phosphatase PhoE
VIGDKHLTTRIILLRHGESAAPQVIHGAESDIGLSDRGRRQAAAVAPILAREKPNVIISSGMLRAIDTARPIAQACGLEMLIEPDLHERRVGALSGMPFGPNEGVWPDTLRRWIGGETGYASEGSESFDDVRSRIGPVWERLASVHAGQTVVIVAHGVVCKVLQLSVVPGWSAADWQNLGSIHNAAITELVQNRAGWQILRLNQMPESSSEL